MERSAAYKRTQKALNNMAGYIRREGLTGWVKDRSAAGHYRQIFRMLVELEDAEGIEATAKLSDRFLKLTWEARDRRLLTPTEIADAEREVLV